MLTLLGFCWELLCFPLETNSMAVGLLFVTVEMNNTSLEPNVQIKSENSTNETTDFGPSLNDSTDEVFVESIYDPDVELETKADVKPVIKFEKVGELKIKKELL